MYIYNYNYSYICQFVAYVHEDKRENLYLFVTQLAK